MKLIDRIAWAHAHLRPVEPRFCIVWEDPQEPDAPAKVTVPSPEWLASALHGGILPPVDVYQFADTVPGILHAVRPIAAMTEEEAMAYMVRWVLPRHVWDPRIRRNRPLFKIVPRAMIPSDRTFRNAWRLSEEMADAA